MKQEVFEIMLQIKSAPYFITMKVFKCDNLETDGVKLYFISIKLPICNFLQKCNIGFNALWPISHIFWPISHICLFSDLKDEVTAKNQKKLV